MDLIKPTLLPVWYNNIKLRHRNKLPLGQKLLNVKVTRGIQLRSDSQQKLPKPKPKLYNSIKTPPPPRTTTNKAKGNEKERKRKPTNNKPKVGVNDPAYELGSLYNYQIRDGDTSDWSQNPDLPPPNLKLRILSIVASARLGCRLDLEKIALRATQVHYNPAHFSPLQLVIDEPYAVAMVFSSGSMIVNGTTSMEDCNLASKKLAGIINACGFRAYPALQVQNITATVNFGFRVRVRSLMTCKPLQGRIFVRESFSGVTIDMTVPRAKIILFQTGKALITGVTCPNDLKDALDFVYPFARKYAR